MESHHRRVCLVLLLALPSFFFAGSADALPHITGDTQQDTQQEVEGVDDSVLNAESLTRLRAEIRETLAGTGGTERQLVLEEQLDELDRAENLLEEGKREPPVDSASAPPFSLRDLDGTLARLQTNSDRRVILQGAVRSAGRTLERATGVAADVRRGVDDEGSSDEAVALAEDRVRLARFQLRNARRELELVQSRVEALADAVKEKQGRLRVTGDDLDERIAALEAERAKLDGRRAEVARSAEEARAAWREAVGKDVDPLQAGALKARFERWKRQGEIFDSMESDLALAEEGWEIRYRLAAGEFGSAIEEKRAERLLAANLSELIHDRDLARSERERIGAEIQRLEAERARTDGGDTLRWLDDHVASLRARRGAESDFAAILDDHVADHRRFLDAFESDGVAGSVREGVTTVGESVANAWNFELTTVDDRPITVGKLVLALVLILAGVLISRIVAGVLRRRLFDKMSMDTSLAASLQTVGFYLLILVFFLIAMRFVNIPLTALTFVGGALAIGIGFGSQNIVNNFISGLILMIERPIKVGDMIEVGGTYGRVERIGGRSTRVRSGNNTHIIVPNSSFLEKEVLNWTLSDATIRTHVDVGVAYGSPTREVFKLLHRVADEHGRILQTPKHEVLFVNFGDNALEFRVYFWIEVREILDQLRMQSDVRFRIDSLFREAGITIAFPQRDVHLDTLRPLDVRVVREFAGKEGEPGPDAS